ncbi:cytochrome c family protein [Azospirillum sp. INR13]|uniref:c-type cytochrome n=1 Tax=Azospirillum sp. INR13 TaxID=2596919 RepID=UPI00351C2A61
MEQDFRRRAAGRADRDAGRIRVQGAGSFEAAGKECLRRRDSEGAAPAADKGAAPAGPAPIAPLLAAASPENGQKVAKACAACHSFDKGGANKVGPNLYGIVGGAKGHIQGFSYSDALVKTGGSWSYDELNKFLYDPKGYAPGTKMTFAGLKKDDDRAAVIAYLRSLADSPQPLPQ